MSFLSLFSVLSPLFLWLGRVVWRRAKSWRYADILCAFMMVHEPAISSPDDGDIQATLFWLLLLSAAVLMARRGVTAPGNRQWRFVASAMAIKTIFYEYGNARF